MQRNKLGDSQSSLSVSDNISQGKKEILSFNDLVKKHQSCKTTVTTADLYGDVTDSEIPKFPNKSMELNFQNFKRILKFKYQKFATNQSRSREQSRMSLEPFQQQFDGAHVPTQLDMNKPCSPKVVAMVNDTAFMEPIQM